MSSIGIIVNPYSKKNKRKPQFADKLFSLIDQNDEIVKTKTLRELEETLLRFKEKNMDYIGVVGGDGSINLVLEKLIKIYAGESIPVILPLKGGTMNVLASHLNIPSSPYRALKDLKDGHKTTRVLNSLNCNGRIGFIYADGSINNFLVEFYRNKSNHIGAIILTVKITLSSIFSTSYSKKLINVFPFSIRANEASYEKNCLANIASTISTIPLGIPLFKDVDKHSDEFQFQSITTSPKFLFLKIFHILFARQAGQQRYKLNLFTKKVGISSAAHPIKYTLDGELFEDDEIKLELGKKIEFISY